MRPKQQLLLPANPIFIWTSLVVALLLTMAPNMAGLGRAAWLPDVLAIVLAFWGVHQPRRVGVGAAFVFGMAMDVHQGALLGQHALAYTALSYLAITVHRRLLWFTVPLQALQILPLFVGAHAIALVVRLLGGGLAPGWPILLAPLLEALLWPIATGLLLWPQRRAPNPDENRPL